MKLRHKTLQYKSIWTWLSMLIVLLILLPNATILVNFFTTDAESWGHVKKYILPDLLKNTSILLLFTGILTIFIGTSLAWLIAAYDFPFRRFFKWGLILPLAIPPYIAGYTYNGLLSYTGFIQTTLRNQFQLDVNQAFFDILTIPGAIGIFTLFLYPYVYTMTYSFLSQQSATLIENARLLGRNATAIYFRIILPITRGAIVGGVSLVLLEVLNDYGVVKYFGVPTFSTAIFQTWFGMGELNSAIKLSATVMFIVFGLLILEKVLRGRKKYSYTTSMVRPLKPITLYGVKRWVAVIYCSIFFLVGFLIPFIQLLDWMFLTFHKVASLAFVELMMNSLLVAMIGSLVIVVFATIIGNFARVNRGFLARTFSRVTILGYSIPGAVIAVGISAVFIQLDKSLFAVYEALGMDATLHISTSLFILISAYIIRFLAVGYNSIEAGFDKIGVSYTEASRMLGMNLTKTFFKVDLPMMKGPLISGFMLAFIEILKELPLTLILRPFNFETLSTKAFQYAGDEQIQEAALPSLIIVLVSAIAIYFFYHVLEKEPR